MGGCCSGQEVAPDVNTVKRPRKEEEKENDESQGSFPDVTSVADLEARLQQAVLLELATIPVYLSGYWSINNPSKNNNILNIIDAVFAEEMKHMALAANLYNCIQDKKNKGTKQPLNMTTLAPKFESLSDGTTKQLSLPGGVLPDLKVTTGYITKEVVLNTYMGIEEPSETISPPANGTYELTKDNKLYLTIGKRITKDYTIGDFYHKIKKGFIDYQNDINFVDTNQFKDVPFLPEIKAINGITEAKIAIDLIISEGEGAAGYPPKFKDSDGMLAHYYRFLEVYVNRKLLGIKKMGETKDDATYEYSFDTKPIVENFWTDPTNFNNYKFVYQPKSNAFQQTYSSLLKNLELYNLTDAINDMKKLQGNFFKSTSEAYPFVYSS